MLLWGSIAICAREGLGTYSADGTSTAIGELVGRVLVSWDAIVVDGGSGWVRSNWSKTRVDTLRIGGDFGSVGVGLAKLVFLLQQIT
jgi:hypothetical protein